MLSKVRLPTQSNRDQRNPTAAFSAFAKAAVAALVIGKVIAVLHWAESGYAADRTHRRIVVVAVNTFLYALVVIVLGIGEKIFHAYRDAGSLGEAVSNLIANANFDRFMGLVLLISFVVIIYLAMQEIEQAMGQGAMFRLFFEPPMNTSNPQDGAECQAQSEWSRFWSFHR